MKDFNVAGIYCLGNDNFYPYDIVVYADSEDDLLKKIEPFANHPDFIVTRIYRDIDILKYQARRFLCSDLHSKT